MARTPRPRLLAFALWAICLVGVVTTRSSQAELTSTGVARAGVTQLQPAAEPALLPARASDELRAAAQLVGLRTLVVVALLAALAGLPAGPWRRPVGPGLGRRALLTRRHSIALRAPPSLLFV